jgi:aminopeptidase N
VLDYNLEKAKKQFLQVPPMLKAFEYWFGPYPFYEDDFKLVEAPHLGMEHQSGVAYGNRYANGYLGRDLSGTGHGLKWDYIIVHESGHEWFGNNITTNDIADLWVHEAFTDYSETLFVEYHYGREAGDQYVQGLRKNIQNDVPIIGFYGVNNEGSGDMYFKGANMIHTLRQVINDDEMFRAILRGLNKTYYHQTVTSKQIEEYIAAQSKKDLKKVFDQYLRTTQIPTLEYKIRGKKIQYRWTNTVPLFSMPIKVNTGTEQWLQPKAGVWSTVQLSSEYDGKKFTVNSNFYVHVKKVD